MTSAISTSTSLALTNTNVLEKTATITPQQKELDELFKSTDNCFQCSPSLYSFHLKIGIAYMFVFPWQALCIFLLFAIVATTAEALAVILGPVLLFVSFVLLLKYCDHEIPPSEYLFWLSPDLYKTQKLVTKMTNLLHDNPDIKLSLLQKHKFEIAKKMAIFPIPYWGSDNTDGRQKVTEISSAFVNCQEIYLGLEKNIPLIEEAFNQRQAEAFNCDRASIGIGKDLTPFVMSYLC